MMWWKLTLTPNRGDCLSITGLARELGVFEPSSVFVDCDPVDRI